jgi:proline iminopeptidase
MPVATAVCTHSRSAQTPRRVDTAEEASMEIAVGGKTVRYEDLGEGRPFVFVHGGLGHDHTYFLPFVEPLAARARLILVDLLGNGHSDAPYDWEAVEDVTVWVDQLHELRQALGLTSWTMLGHSFGGFVVQTYALEHQDDLDGLVVCTSSGRVDHLEASVAAAQRLATPEQFEVLTTELFEHMESDEHYARVWREVFPVYFYAPDPAVMSGVDERMTYRAAAFNAAVKVLPTVDVLDRLPELRIPTLVIGATQDWTFPPEHGPKKIHAAVAGSTYVEIDECGHYPFIEHPDQFNAVVADFLDSLPPWHERS